MGAPIVLHHVSHVDRTQMHFLKLCHAKITLYKVSLYLNSRHQLSIASSKIIGTPMKMSTIKGANNFSYNCMQYWLMNTNCLCFYILIVFVFSQPDAVRHQPREIPHNEKLLSLKYEVINIK